MTFFRKSKHIFATSRQIVVGALVYYFAAMYDDTWDAMVLTPLNFCKRLLVYYNAIKAIDTNDLDYLFPSTKISNSLRYLTNKHKYICMINLVCSKCNYNMKLVSQALDLIKRVTSFWLIPKKSLKPSIMFYHFPCSVGWRVYQATRYSEKTSSPFTTKVQYSRPVCARANKGKCIKWKSLQTLSELSNPSSFRKRMRQSRWAFHPRSTYQRKRQKPMLFS